MGIVNNIKNFFSKNHRGKNPYLNLRMGTHRKGEGIKRDLSPREMSESYQSAVFSAVKRIADMVAMTDFGAYEYSNDKWEQVNDPNNPFNKLFKDPNPIMDAYEVMERLSIDLDLTGNAYLYVVKDSNGVPVEVHPLLSYRMTIVPAEQENKEGDLVAGYIYSLDDNINSININDRGTAFSKDEIIHFKTANPMSVFYGNSPIESSQYSIEVDKEMSVQRLRLLQNRAIPEGILTSQRPLTQNDAERIRHQWNQLYQGRSKRGRVAVLDSGTFNFQRLGLNAEELEFTQGKEAVWREIFACYRVPYAILGGKDVNKATVEAAERIFQLQGVKPRLLKIQATINKWLMPMFGGMEMEFRFDDPTSKDSTFRLEEKKTNLQLGVSTINEERIKDGLPPVAWGETAFMPMNLVQVGQDGEVPQDEKGLQPISPQELDKIIQSWEADDKDTDNLKG
tara:strand:- start:586 stop:1941 length:1356 start_codon:yes stop_codon:yes gene_type:complete